MDKLVQSRSDVLANRPDRETLVTTQELPGQRSRSSVLVHYLDTAELHAIKARLSLHKSLAASRPSQGTAAVQCLRTEKQRLQAPQLNAGLQGKYGSAYQDKPFRGAARLNSFGHGTAAPLAEAEDSMTATPSWLIPVRYRKSASCTAVLKSARYHDFIAAEGKEMVADRAAQE